MSDRIELGDPAEAHLLRLGEGLLGENLFELREQLRPRDEKAARASIRFVVIP